MTLSNIFQYIIFIMLISSCHSSKVATSTLLDHGFQYALVGGVTHDQGTILIKGSVDNEFKITITEEVSKKMVTSQKAILTKENNFQSKIIFKNLKASTKYTYEITPKGSSLPLLSSSFSTFDNKSMSFKFVFGSCSETGSNSPIYNKILKENPLFYLQIGDLHYENIDSNCTQRFQDAYKSVFTSPSQSSLYKSVPFVYMWDDHDFGPNNADATNPCKTESIAAYKSHVPHYPIVFDKNDGPISQTFEVGRVVFLLTDIRSQKIRPEYRDCERTKIGTNFGDEAHLQWFLDAMLKAKKEGKVVAWVSSYPWINAPGGPNYKCKESDNWGGYPEERQRIANFIKQHDIPVFILSGDAHMVAMDDGTNSDYATDGGAPIKVFHAAALDRPGSYKGGPYSHGYSKEPGQFGIVEITDDGNSKVCFKWFAKDTNGNIVKNTSGQEIRLDFCLDVEK